MVSMHKLPKLDVGRSVVGEDLCRGGQRIVCDPDRKPPIPACFRVGEGAGARPRHC